MQTVRVSNGTSSLTAVVFPNLATDQLTVRLSQPYAGKAQCWLFDAQGRTVQELSRPLCIAGSDIHLSVEPLPNSVYALRLLLDGQVLHKQIVVQHLAGSQCRRCPLSPDSGHLLHWLLCEQGAISGSGEYRKLKK